MIVVDANAIQSSVAADLATRPLLRDLPGRGGVLLHGSTTFGVRDAFADLDLWLLAPATDVARFDEQSPTRFIEFKFDGVPGHYTVETIESFAERVTRCDLPLIAELRYAQPIGDPSSEVLDLIRRAALPMPADVREAWFAYHYVEMRSEHRALDNPLNRGDAVATLLAASSTLAHALRAACVLDGRPYHYSKWLARHARAGPAGEEVARLTDETIALLATDVLRLRADEHVHPLNLNLKAIRNALNASARANGLDRPYLDAWWLHLTTSRAATRDILWP